MSLLETINSPDDLKKLTVEELTILAQEIRDYIIKVIPDVGGHFASSLGVVELTIALHYIYNTPDDKLVWDVGHQGYVHKILTGRREALKQIRQYDGISGFLCRDESPYDVFGAGHASTAISSALGIAKARDLTNRKFRVVAVVGDGGITGGLAYEGLNNAGASGTDITVVLNDNNMSISRNVGAMSKYLVSVVTNPFYQRLRNKVWELTGHMPKSNTLRQLAHKIEESFKSLVIPGMLFDDMGFRYYGPIDGHNLKEVLIVLTNIRDLPGPQIVHFITRKGKGCEYAEKDPVAYHGVKGTKNHKSIAHDETISTPLETTYTDVFGDAIVELAEQDKRICAVTAAMKEGTGLVSFAERFPERFFDVGIAEGHAITFSGGLATEGMRPVAAIYSTFLQRAFDHILHDISLQHLPVVFAIDRAGIVGEDGPTHHGCFDLSYLGCIPGIVISAPKDGTELRNLLYTGICFESAPFAVRYPRAAAPAVIPNAPFQKLPVGVWEILTTGTDVVILASGSMVYPALSAANNLKINGISAEVVNARFIKPIDKELIKNSIEHFEFIVTVEENSIIGGLGDAVTSYCTEQNWNINRILKIGLPDSFITHGPRSYLLEIIGLTSEAIAKRIKEFITKSHSTSINQLL